MNKENFVTLIMGTIGGIIFALGVCMCLISDWNSFTQGVITGAVGLAVLLVMLIVRRKMQGKPAVVLNARAVGTIILGILGTLIFGIGMCMTMVWEGMLIPGIAVGIVGIIMLICLIPVCKGIQQNTEK